MIRNEATKILYLPIYTCMSMKLIVKFVSLHACDEWNFPPWLTIEEHFANGDK